MDSTNAFEIIPAASVLECTPNLKIDEDSMKVQANPITLNNLNSSDEKKPAKEAKLSRKRKEVTEERPLKRKKATPLLMSQMVMESIKALKKQNGASVQAILEYIEGQYKINAKLIKHHVSKYLLSAVEKGILEQSTSAGTDGRFKIKKVMKTKVEQKLKGDLKLIKAEKVTKLGQKSNDNQKKIKSEKVAKVEKKPNQKKAKGEKVAEVKKKFKINYRR